MNLAIDKETAMQSGKRFASLVRSEIDSEALVLLFGSCVKNKANDRSDIDLAVVSKTFGKNVVENRVRISLLGYRIHPDIEVHAFSAEDWKDVTPFINEIKKTGVAL